MSCLSRWFLFLSLMGGLVLPSACGIDRQVGEPCYGSYECKPGLFCKGGLCANPQGGRCQASSDCLSTQVCRFDRCVEKSILTVCDRNLPCPGDLYCKDGYCTVSGEGRSCTRDLDCPSELICEVNTCRPGIRCQYTTDCPSDYVCEEERCVQEPREFECSSAEECSEGEICVDGFCESP